MVTGIKAMKPSAMLFPQNMTGMLSRPNVLLSLCEMCTSGKEISMRHLMTLVRAESGYFIETKGIQGPPM